MVHVRWKYFPINNLLFPAICDNLVRVDVWGHMVHSDMEILSNHQCNISYICDHFEWVDAWGHKVHVTRKYYSINNSILLDVIESLELNISMCVCICVSQIYTSGNIQTKTYPYINLAVDCRFACPFACPFVRHVLCHVLSKFVCHVSWPNQLKTSPNLHQMEILVSWAV